MATGAASCSLPTTCSPSSATKSPALPQTSTTTKAGTRSSAPTARSTLKSNPALVKSPLSLQHGSQHSTPVLLTGTQSALVVGRRITSACFALTMGWCRALSHRFLKWSAMVIGSACASSVTSSASTTKTCRVQTSGSWSARRLMEPTRTLVTSDCCSVVIHSSPITSAVGMWISFPRRRVLALHFPPAPASPPVPVNHLHRRPQRPSHPVRVPHPAVVNRRQ